MINGIRRQATLLTRAFSSSWLTDGLAPASSTLRLMMVLQADCPWVSDCFCCLVYRLGVSAFTVGASLLAIAVVQSTFMLDVTQSSRAGSLPQGDSVWSGRAWVQIAIASGLGQLTGHYVAQQRG